MKKTFNNMSTREAVKAFFTAAQKRDSTTMMEFLEKYGAGAIDSRNDDGETALMHAAEKGYRNIVALLLNKGAAVDTKDMLGKTALTWAAKNGHTDVAVLLIDNGADILEKDSNGITPLELARLNGFPAAAKAMVEEDKMINEAARQKKADLAAIAEHFSKGTTRPLPYKGPLFRPPQP